MKLLFIEWEDSCQGRGWEPTENFCHTRSMRCFSVGWKVAESKDSITLAPHVSEKITPLHFSVLRGDDDSQAGNCSENGNYFRFRSGA